jgi:hypothetical protein
LLGFNRLTVLTTTSNKFQYARIINIYYDKSYSIALPKIGIKIGTEMRTETETGTETGIDAFFLQVKMKITLLLLIPLLSLKNVG